MHSCISHSVQPRGSGTKHPEPPTRRAKVRNCRTPAQRLPRSPSTSLPAPAWGRGGGRRGAQWRPLSGPGGGGCNSCRRRGRCRGIDPSAQPSRGLGAETPAGAEQAAGSAAGRVRPRSPSPYLGLGRRLHTRQPPQRTWGGGPGRGGVSARVSPVDF